MNHSLSKPTFVLFSGLWEYAEVDSKKSLSRLNVIHNKQLKRSLEDMLGLADLCRLTVRGMKGEPQRLFPMADLREPNLVSTSLQALLPSDHKHFAFTLTELMSGDLINELPVSEGGRFVYLVSTSYVTNFRDFEKLIKAIRALPNGLIVVGGYLGMRNPERTLESGADVVCIGDAEVALPKLIETIDNRDSWSRIPNLAYRGVDGLVRTQPLNTEMDLIPLAAPSGDLSDFAVPYESMRGCPFKCAFCSYPLVSTIWRYKSAEKVISDFSELQARRASRIIVLDSTFTVPPARLRRFLTLYLERGLSIPWGAYSRTPTLQDLEIVQNLKKANCRWLSIGFESGSDKMLTNMNKKATVEHSRQALRNLKQVRISPWSNFIIGFPGETNETVRETQKFITAHIFGFYGLYVFNIRDRAMPALENPIFNVTYSDIDGDWEHCTMTSDKALELRTRAYCAIAFNNNEAINIDVFRDTGVESVYDIWDPSFPILKALEKLAVSIVFREHLGPFSANEETDLIRFIKDRLY